MSTALCRARMRSATFFTAAASPTSSGSISAAPPVLAMPAATSSRALRRRPERMTRAPMAASCSAPACPMPLPAPVTHAIFPANVPTRASSDFPEMMSAADANGNAGDLPPPPQASGGGIAMACKTQRRHSATLSGEEGTMERPARRVLNERVRTAGRRGVDLFFAEKQEQAPPQRRPGLTGFLLHLRQEIADDHLSIVSAGVAFWTLLTVFPAIGVLVSIYGLVSDAHPGARHATL